MADTVKFTDEELAEIKTLQNLYNTVVFQAGQVHIDSIAFEERKRVVEANLEEVKGKETELVSKLTTKYGQGSINLESGEFTPVSTDAVEDTVEEATEE